MPIKIVEQFLKSIQYKRAYHSKSSGYQYYKTTFSTWDHKKAFAPECYLPTGNSISILQREENYGATDFYVETRNLDLAVILCKELNGKMSTSKESGIPDWN